uniref:Uncharacterized protein n=1 Tax=Vitis vinifera TaxID=29760 RepID=F6I220_VITVI
MRSLIGWCKMKIWMGHETCGSSISSVLTEGGGNWDKMHGLSLWAYTTYWDES